MVCNITILDVEYAFNFGMGFMRKLNKQLQVPVPNAPGVKQDAGLRFKIASLFEGDIEALEDILIVANEGQSPRLTRAVFDEYIENEDTDVDSLFDQVLDFLRLANVTKRLTKDIEEAIAKGVNQ